MTENTPDLAAIKERAGRATEGPWVVEVDQTDSTVFAVRGEYVGTCPDCGVRGGYRVADAEFIAHARTDVVELADEVESLRLRVGDLLVASDFDREQLGKASAELEELRSERDDWNSDATEALIRAEKAEALVESQRAEIRELRAAAHALGEIGPTSAEAALADLRAKVTALADEWDAEAERACNGADHGGGCGDCAGMVYAAELRDRLLDPSAKEGE